MAETIDELTIKYEEDGEVLVKELDKVVLSKGAWCTILFRYQELDKKTGEFGPAKAGLRRYQKRGGYFIKKDAVNITPKMAPLFHRTIKDWFDL